MFKSTVPRLANSPEAGSFPHDVDIRRNFGKLNAMKNVILKACRDGTMPEGSNPVLRFFRGFHANLPDLLWKYGISVPDLSGLRSDNDAKQVFESFEYDYGQGMPLFETVFYFEMFSAFIWTNLPTASPNQHSIKTILDEMEKTAEQCPDAREFLNEVFPESKSKQELLDAAEQLNANLLEGRFRDDSPEKNEKAPAKGKRKNQLESPQKQIIEGSAQGFANAQKNTRGPYHIFHWLLLGVVEHGVDPQKLHQAIEKGWGKAAADQAVRLEYAAFIRSKLPKGDGTFQDMSSMDFPLGDSTDRLLKVRRLLDVWDPENTGAMTGLMCGLHPKLPKVPGTGAPQEAKALGELRKLIEGLHVGWIIHPHHTAMANITGEVRVDIRNPKEAGKLWAHGHFGVLSPEEYEAIFGESPTKFDQRKKLPQYRERRGGSHDVITPVGYRGRDVRKSKAMAQTAKKNASDKIRAKLS